MEVLGLIFSNIHNKEVFEVTQVRTIASTPIGGRYRLIDFPLSNMVNAGIHHIGIVTKNNYQSLMDHLGSGKDWDLARKKGGLVILPPYGYGDQVYNTRLEAIKYQINFVESSKAEYVILTDCYHVCNVDYTEALKYHINKGADITCIYHEHNVKGDDFAPAKVFTLDDDNRITKLDISPEFTGKAKVSIDTWIMKRTLLLNICSEAINTNYKSFNKDILSRNLKNYKIYGYEHKGYFVNISDLQTFYNANIDLINKDIRRELFYQEGKAIYTKVRDSAPTKYGKNAKVTNSIIADGCIVEGEVRNSVIFRGARIRKGCVVENSILMQDTDIACNTYLSYVITDKNVKIKNKNEVVGSLDRLVYVKKGGVL